MRHVATLAVCSLAFVGCDKKEEDKYGSVKIQFVNAESVALADTDAATGLGVKLKYMRITNGTGSADAGPSLSTMIWASPVCSTTSTDDAGIVVGEMKSDADCDAAGIEYFDLARSTDAVNTALNSQAAQVMPGTYTHIGFSLLGEQQGGNNTFKNIQWAHDGSGTAARDYVSVQSEWFATFDPPLEIGEGEAVTATLVYTLDGSVTLSPTDPQIRTEVTQPGAFDDCSDDKSACFSFPTLGLSASR